MLEFLTLKPQAFGLDISDLSLKVVNLKKNNKFLDLDWFSEAKIKPGVIEKGEILKKKLLVETIKKSLQKVQGGKIKTKYVVASLPEDKAFLQVIQLPKMKQEELEKAVLFEAENYVPMPIDDVYLDFQLVRPVIDHLDHFDVLIAALPKKTVDPYVECLKAAGLCPMALEIESLAIARALIKDGLSSSSALLIDLGAVRTSFIIFAGYSLRFTSCVAISSQVFTDAIALALNIDFKKAEKLKLNNTQTKKKSAQSKKIRDALIPSFIDLAEQIKKYLSFYQSHTGHEHLKPNGSGVKKIELCGGGANLEGLAEFLIKELKIPVVMANPWVNILPEPQKEASGLNYKNSLAFTTALGLAIRGII